MQNYDTANIEFTAVVLYLCFLMFILALDEKCRKLK